MAATAKSRRRLAARDARREERQRKKMNKKERPFSHKKPSPRLGSGHWTPLGKDGKEWSALYFSLRRR